MNIAMIFRVALLAIMRNKTRSLLTCLGIIVGIAAVIAVLAIGKGASTMMLNEISTMGNNLVMVFPDRNRQGQVRSGMGSGQTMTADDAEAIKRELPHLVQYVSPTVNASSQLVYQNRNWNCRLHGGRGAQLFPRLRHRHNRRKAPLRGRGSHRQDNPHRHHAVQGGGSAEVQGRERLGTGPG